MPVLPAAAVACGLILVLLLLLFRVCLAAGWRGLPPDQLPVHG
jgi:hypothetical protein